MKMLRMNKYDIPALSLVAEAYQLSNIRARAHVDEMVQILAKIVHILVVPEGVVYDYMPSPSGAVDLFDPASANDIEHLDGAVYVLACQPGVAFLHPGQAELTCGSFVV